MSECRSACQEEEQAHHFRWQGPAEQGECCCKSACCEEEEADSVPCSSGQEGSHVRSRHVRLAACIHVMLKPDSQLLITDLECSLFHSRCLLQYADIGRVPCAIAF